MTPRSLDPPFGAYAFSGPLESVRRIAALMPRNRFGRLCVSAIRRLCVRGRPGPFDVEVFPTIRARLYPASNRCEKRAVAGVQLFDFGERGALRDALSGSETSPFVFVDLGANVGLYSLWMVSVARAVKRPFQGLAVEPDPETRARLETNLAASGASGDVAVAPVAVGETAGRGTIVAHGQNRGEHMVRAAETADTDTVEILTVQDICARHGIARIDAMKIDLEGHDEGALRGLFGAAPQTLWPELIVVEAGKGSELPPVVRLCLDNGYRLDRRTRLNALLTRASRPS
ncbi:FkbM family methyltransferase [Stappia sp. ES.058]|uniref:FkbM family methyltransferase n=1 Tax=Stappia sp. ES.058 TaxID=1881061 RepID=UPI00087CA057|nr:FkbM family methyltransferase [Stappia sp. ES.058]SDU46140.1 methyltransferase, FkbM family [Stappia sp. ES.058]